VERQDRGGLNADEAVGLDHDIVRFAVNLSIGAQDVGFSIGFGAAEFAWAESSALHVEGAKKKVVDLVSPLAGKVKEPEGLLAGIVHDSGG
jgi:hypothetical protein